MEDAGRPEDERRDRPGEGGAELRPPAAAQLARDQRDEENRSHAATEADDAECDERVAEGVARGEGRECHERREVDVPEREVPRGGQEVELVPIPAVAAEERRSRGDEYDARRRSSDERGRDRGAKPLSR